MVHQFPFLCLSLDNVWSHFFQAMSRSWWLWMLKCAALQAFWRSSRPQEHLQSRIWATNQNGHQKKIYLTPESAALPRRSRRLRNFVVFISWRANFFSIVVASIITIWTTNIMWLSPAVFYLKHFFNVFTRYRRPVMRPKQEWMLFFFTRYLEFIHQTKRRGDWKHISHIKHKVHFDKLFNWS